MLTCSDPEYVNDVVKKVQEIEGLIKSVVALTEGAEVITCALFAAVLLIVQNVQGNVSRVAMISHQFKKVAPAMRKSSGGKY